MPSPSRIAKQAAHVVCLACLPSLAALAGGAGHSAVIETPSTHSSPRSLIAETVVGSWKPPGDGPKESLAGPYTTAFKSKESKNPNWASEEKEIPSKELAKAPVTVADSIRMTRVAGSADLRDRYTGGVFSDFAVFSPDGKRFVVVVRRGNLDQNTMEYSMLLWATDRLFNASAPRTIITFASSSYREGIRDVRWLDDNDTLLFLGEHPGETTQLYSVRCSTGTPDQLTHGPHNVVGYGSSADGRRIVLGIQNPTRNLSDESVRRNGLTVSAEPLKDLASGHLDECCQEIFVMERGDANLRPVRAQGKVWQDPLALFVSPDGRYLVVRTGVEDPPDEWKGYEDSYLRSLFKDNWTHSSIAAFARYRMIDPGFTRYELVDLETGVSQILLDSPVGFMGADVGWASDSRSVILTDVFLPLKVRNSAELDARKTHVFTVEVAVPGREIFTIAENDLALVGWDLSNRYLKFRPSRKASDRFDVDYYEKKNHKWERLQAPRESIEDYLPDITVDQDLNKPPRIIARDLKSGRKEMILDLNPQFVELALGKVEDVKWVGGAGHEVHGGLYLPPDYLPGRRYPLVVQTHGFDPHGFWIDGSFTTAFAAQALAGKGIIVLQVPDGHDGLSTPEEAPLMVKTFERAIDYLDSRGLIDPALVGIIGFSRTCLYVKYMLTHSKYRLGAATVADGWDSGYFQYMVYALDFQEPLGDDDSSKLNGAAPFGEGLLVWLNRSPGFLLDKVHTPIRVEAHGALDGAGVLGEWEWFAGLRRLGKPVEFLYLPEGAHVLDRPLERMASQQGDVDWFCFWLKGEEDHDPAKGEQYKRWRELRKLQQANGPSQHSN